MANELADPQGGVMAGVAGLPPFMRQILLLAGLAGAVALGVAVVQWAQEPNYGLLFGNLGDKDTSHVLEALTKSNIPYRLDPGSGAILVPAKQVHDARLKLASQGLPKGSSVGFELIDDKPAFGASQLQESARYHRAMEGELARTIASMANVANARVHLAIPKQSAFIREQEKPRASVLINTHAGRVLEDGQVAAIVHLVASSVPNLSAERVTVIDHKGKLLTGSDATRDLSTSANQFEYARKLEAAYARRIEEILAPVVGAGAIKAQVATDLDFTISEQTRESFNPQQVVRSEQTAEETTVGGPGAAGVPGALSNQPPGAATVPETTKGATPPAGGKTPLANAASEVSATPLASSKRATRNYELDKTISYTKSPTGVVKRVSVAVVVDDVVSVSAKGKVSRKPRKPEDLERYTALVKEAIGFDEKRGDTVSVVNAAFNTPPAEAPLPELPLWKQEWVWDLAKQIGGALAAFLILLLIVRPLLKGITRQAAVPAYAGAALTPDQVSLAGAGAAAQLPANSADSHMTTAKTIAQQDPKRVAQVVKNWVGNDG